MSPHRLCFALSGSVSGVLKDRWPHFTCWSTVATAAAPSPPALHGGSGAHGRAAAGVTASFRGAALAANFENGCAPPLAESPPLSAAPRCRAVLTAAVQLAGLLYLVAAVAALLSSRHAVVALLRQLDPLHTGVAASAVAAARTATAEVGLEAATTAIAVRGGATVATASAGSPTENDTTAVAVAVAAAAAALGDTPLPLRCALTPAVLWSSMHSRFFVAHAAGWAAKAVAIRDRRLLWAASLTWEVVEASLVGILPNFAECWWDAALLDVGLANAVGIEVGLAAAAAVGAVSMVWTCPIGSPDWGNPKRRRRRQLQQSPRRRGGWRRRQQLVWSWVGLGWHAQSMNRPHPPPPPRAGRKRLSDCQLMESDCTRRCFLGATGVVVVLTLADLNAFTLKAAMDVPVASPLNVARLLVVAALGVPAAAEYQGWIGRWCAHEWVVSAATATAGPMEEVEERPYPRGRVGCALALVAVLVVEVAVALKFWGGRFAGRTGATAAPWSLCAGWMVAALACVVWLRRRFGCS